MYICTECDAKYSSFKGACKNCGSVATVVEDATPDVTIPASGTKTSARLPTTAATPLSSASSTLQRKSTQINEFDRVLGGGIVQSEVVLLAGNPGGGKSTISLHLAGNVASKDFPVLYISGEEAVEGLKIRADRLGITNDHLYLVHSTNLEENLGHIHEIKPKLFIVDSLQAVASEELSGTLGSIQQSKKAAHVLHNAAKKNGMQALFINQITKDGDFAGSAGIQHIVDASLFLESHRETPLKFLRADKNRFGATDEVGVFQHSDKGLEEVTDPSGVLVDSDNDPIEGAALGFMSEGVRQIPMEVQALITSSTLPNPRKQFNGINANRGQIICAILDKFAYLSSFENDVFSSTVFGVRVNDPQCDLAIAAAMLSSIKDQPLNPKMAFVGELNLTGRVRGSSRMEAITREAKRLGIEKIVLPSNSIKNMDDNDVEYIGIDHVRELPKILKRH